MNSPKNWDLRIDDNVWRMCRKFPRKDLEVIRAVISGLPDNPFAGDIEKMKGEEYNWRRRVGSYRLFYELHVDTKTIYVTAVKRRTSGTY